jgi:hypothetical protein
MLGVTKGSSLGTYADCPEETVLVGGGARFLGDYPESVSITASWPFGDPPSRYFGEFARIADVDDNGGQRDVSVFAICAAIAALE